MSPSDPARRAFLEQFLRDRLVGPAAGAEWARILAAAWRALSARPVETLLPRAEANLLVDAYLTPERLMELVRPIAGTIVREAVAQLRADQEPLDRWVPKASAERIERIAARPKMVDPAWIRTLFQERAVEELLADTLYATIRDFSTIVPRLLMSLLPTGRLGVLGGAAGIGARIVEELERRLEPEIKSFLKSGTKRALERASDYALAHLDDPVSRELRKNVVRFVLARSPSFHVAALEDEVLREIEEIAVEIARHVAGDPELRARIARTLDDIYERWGSLSLEEALRRLGAAVDPPLDAWAAASWPLVSAAIDGAGLARELSRLVDEAIEAFSRDPSLAPSGPAS